MNKRTIKIIVWTSLVTLIIALVGFAGIVVCIGHKFSSPFLFVTKSQANGHEASFVLEGFVDRGWTLFVKPKSEIETRRVTELDWDGIYRFQGAEWSKDGQVIVVTLCIAAHNWREFKAYAFDFEKGRALLPDGKTFCTLPSSIDWIALQSNVVSLVADHGGFSGDFVTENTMKRLSTPISAWQMAIKSKIARRITWITIAALLALLATRALFTYGRQSVRRAR
jgi:hypothetical protein